MRRTARAAGGTALTVRGRSKGPRQTTAGDGKMRRDAVSTEREDAIARLGLTRGSNAGSKERDAWKGGGAAKRTRRSRVSMTDAGARAKGKTQGIHGDAGTQDTGRNARTQTQ